MPPIGFSCALKGSCCQQRGPAASTATTTNTTAPKTQTTSPTTPRLSAFFTEVVCTLGTTPPQTVISPPPNGGNGVIRTTTRRRHADSQPLMLQNPTATGVEGTGGTAGPGPRHRRDRKAELRAAVPVGGGAGQRANVPIEARGADGRSGRADTTASRISHAIPSQHESTQAQKPQNINDQNQTPTCAHGNCMRNCWLTAIAGHQGDAPNHTSAH